MGQPMETATSGKVLLIGAPEKRMSLQLLVAHTGSRLDADPASLSSLDALRSFIAKATSIPPHDQILLTTRGKHVKLQALLTEKEIFVYDRDLFSLPPNHSPESIIPSTQLPEPFTPPDPPDTLSNQNDLKAWQVLFKARRDWATSLVERCRSMCSGAKKYLDERTIVDKGVRIATANHEAHIRSLEKKHKEAQAWSEDVVREQEFNIQSWEDDLARLQSIPAKADFRRFISGAPDDPTPKRPRRVSVGGASLDTFIDVEAAKNAVSTSQSVTSALERRVTGMGNTIKKLASDYSELIGAIDQSQNRSALEEGDEPVRLLQEIEVVAKKVASDYDHVLTLPPASKSVAQVSKMALLHTRNYLPSIAEYSVEMDEVVRRALSEKNNSVTHFVEHMQAIAAIESTLSSVNSELSSLDVPADGLEAFEVLALLSRLPFVYGSLLVESIRRREWADKMKQDSSALAEEIAGYREEEGRRRKRWLKSIGDVVNPDALQGQILGVEINLQGDDQRWPYVTRQELQEYQDTLRRVGGQEATLEALAQAMNELDKPAKQRGKRVGNFKSGSVHEAAFGNGSFMRGDEEMRMLMESNTKLEEELKGQKSRVRKLEDLLHRQSHVKRLLIGGGFQPQAVSSPEPLTPEPARDVISPQPQNDRSRRSSVSSRRFSSNQATDEKALTQRILGLEAELAAEREHRAGMEKATLSKLETGADMQRQIEEANSTKKDLMENMEAQQKEFSEERRSLEEELTKCRIRIEEVEDELDRILGSRHNERTENDTKTRVLAAELDEIRRDSADRMHQAQSRIEELENALNKRNKANTEHVRALRVIRSHLTSEDPSSEDQADLASDLEALVQRSLNQVKDLQEALANARSENGELSHKLEEQQAEMAKAQEAAATEHAKVLSLTAELEEERGHLQQLRTKFAEGETGSEALRQRVAEEEKRVGRLSTELAAARSHNNHLDLELLSLQKKHSVLKADASASGAHMWQRQLRAKELTQRLYAQNERLIRLLEDLGLMVTQQDNTFLIQRAPKSGASTILAESSLPMSRSASTPSPARKSFDGAMDLPLLDWMHEEDPEAEAARYAEYLKAINRLNLDVVSEVVKKRCKDMEHTARKWQKEARAYRDKSHRAQSEAHEKIAFRSFKEGDLALFLPTRNQATRPWAAFNVGAPHYFLREHESHRLHNKEWLVARISKVEERIVDLSKTMDSARSIAETSDGGASFEDDNPFELSDGLRWYLLDAAEEKGGAPTTPGLGKSSIASVTRVDARGKIGPEEKAKSKLPDASKTLNKSLESRRSSGNSKKSASLRSPSITKADSSEALLADALEASKLPPANAGPSRLREESHMSATGLGGVDTENNPNDEVRKDLLWGP
ncbi:oligomeric, coiled-coil, peripheral membrane protein [Coniosporium apollinis]|uniref:Autophagy-related protein 11 n=1 Tax=Coniosporium apollinis TaxID=61459 RepID=A0ABQ9P064_9PEZI|nr:oligomeric, coiled-coil, peripheral membrane protein [Coniosporium apollinis]